MANPEMTDEEAQKIAKDLSLKYVSECTKKWTKLQLPLLELGSAYESGRVLALSGHGHEEIAVLFENFADEVRRAEHDARHKRN